MKTRKRIREDPFRKPWMVLEKKRKKWKIYKHRMKRPQNATRLTIDRRGLKNARLGCCVSEKPSRTLVVRISGKSGGGIRVLGENLLRQSWATYQGVVLRGGEHLFLLRLRFNLKICGEGREDVLHQFVGQIIHYSMNNSLGKEV